MLNFRMMADDSCISDTMHQFRKANNWVIQTRRSIHLANHMAYELVAHASVMW